MRYDCPICGENRSKPIDYRAQTPVLMNRLYPSRDAARAASYGKLDIVACNTCGFAWNRAFEPELVIYDADYENDQAHSAAFQEHVKARAADVIGSVPTSSPIDYLEIGCGQGGFIDEVARAGAGRLRSAEGFDPAWRGSDSARLNGSRIHKVYFTAEEQHRLIHTPNVVTSRHTIEHVPDPVAFLRTIRTALGPDSRAVIFIETPCIAWILANEAMQDIFYEHCSIFTANALRYALEKSGFSVDSVHHVFGGQYLWAKAAAGANIDPRPLPNSTLGELSEAGSRFIAKWRSAVSAAREFGAIAIWGAGAKGVTFALLTDPDAKVFDCAIDINPGKQGLHLAGSGLQVVSPHAAAQRKLKTIFVMNPNYVDEIRRLASDSAIDAALIPIN